MFTRFWVDKVFLIINCEMVESMLFEFAVTPPLIQMYKHTTELVRCLIQLTSKNGMGKLFYWNLMEMFHNIVDKITCEKLIMTYPSNNLLKISVQKQPFFQNTLFRVINPSSTLLKNILFRVIPTSKWVIHSFKYVNFFVLRQYFFVVLLYFFV